jgi:hypothetical protein
MSGILEYKWGILLGLEVLAWISTFFMFYARYGMKSNLWFKVGVAAFAITGVIPQVILGIMNFIYTRKLDSFTITLVLLILYGATIGKKDVKKVDEWAKRKFSKRTSS